MRNIYDSQYCADTQQTCSQHTGPQYTRKKETYLQYTDSQYYANTQQTYLQYTGPQYIANTHKKETYLQYTDFFSILPI